jgi:hypothetical protein
LTQGNTRLGWFAIDSAVFMGLAYNQGKPANSKAVQL